MIPRFQLVLLLKAMQIVYFTSGTVGPTATTSGTSFDFTVPSTCTRIVVQFFVSLSGTNDIPS